MIREDILQQFPELFGTKKVNGREINVEAHDRHAHPRVESRDRGRLDRAPRAVKRPRTSPRKIRMAEMGRHVSRSRYRPVLDFSPDRARLDRQLSRARERMALAAQRRDARPEGRPSIDESRAGTHRAVASAGHGIQCAEQPGPHEYAGLRRRLAAAFSAGRRARQPAGR